MTTPPQNPAQAEIDADVATLSQVFTSLGSIGNDLQSLVTNLRNQIAGLPSNVNTDGLDAVAEQAQAILSQFQAMDTPADPDPTPAPVDPSPEPDPTPAPDPVVDPAPADPGADPTAAPDPAPADDGS